MTTLENSYCVPRTVEEWASLGGIIPIGYRSCHQKDAVSYFVHNGKGYVADLLPQDRTEIPVSRFLDLLHDRIVPWRLEEVGFDTHPQGLPRFAYKIKKAGSIVVVFQNENPNPAIYIMSAKDVTPVNLTTFTDLLTLIRMLTPPSND